MDRVSDFDSSNKIVGAMVLFYVLSAIAAILYGIYYVSTRKFNYWKDQNVPHLKPIPIFGNYKDYFLTKKFIADVIEEICSKFPNEPYIGTFYGTEPALLVKSPELIKLVTTKDFYYFSGREVSDYVDREVPVMNNMFLTYGDRWRVIRQNSTALFSSAKMKNMFHLIEKCAHQFQGLLDKEAKSSSVEVRSMTSRFTMDVIGACAFGIDTNVMTKVEGNAFKQIGDAIFSVSYFGYYYSLFHSLWPSIFYGLGLKLFPASLTNFFNNLLKEVFNARNYKESGRNDLVDLMMSMKKKDFVTGDSMRSLKTGQEEKVSLKVDDDFIVAPSLTFFAAGFETSSTTMGYCLFELAKNEETQKKALEEVDAYMLRHKNKLEYECITEMPFLEACVDETLRLYPVLAMLPREVVEDYTLPSGVLLKKGLRVHIPVYHVHHKAEYFPEPEKFRPERFLGEEKRNIIPYTFMPFGEGPRTCIGMRFARMTVMATLITILKSYSVQLAASMPSKLQFEPRSMVTRPIGSAINLRLVPRAGREQRLFAS